MHPIGVCPIPMTKEVADTGRRNLYLTPHVETDAGTGHGSSQEVLPGRCNIRILGRLPTTVRVLRLTTFDRDDDASILLENCSLKFSLASHSTAQTEVQLAAAEVCSERRNGVQPIQRGASESMVCRRSPRVDSQPHGLIRLFPF